MQQRLNAHVSDAIHFGFVERIDLHAGCDKDSIEKCQAIDGFANCAGGNNPHLVGARDTVLVQQTAITFQHPHAIFDRRLANASLRKGVLAERDTLRDAFKRKIFPSLSISAIRHSDAGRANVDHRDRAFIDS